MQDRLAEAIRMRELGRAKQDQDILERARTLIMDLATDYPDNAEVTFQAAIVHDNLGRGREAIPYYVSAIAAGLTGANLERAFLGLGSTYRTLGEFQQSVETLQRGVSEFPHHRALQVFLAMALYNSQRYKEAMEILLTNLMETTADETLQYFKRPILAYTEDLDETW